MRCALSVLCAVAVGCAGPELASYSAIDYSPAPTVTAEEAIAIAESYRVHPWIPVEANAYHGLDPNGILVHTPDVSLNPQVASRPGWWHVDKVNMGIPYQWGGFDTPQSFNQKLMKGYYAGDVYTRDKRRKLHDGVSDYACGVDCSGFISRCLRLDRPYSTRQLASLCDPLDSFDDLQPGDIINKHNAHVLLFVRFLSAQKKAFVSYETGSPPTWKVLRQAVSVDYVKREGYRPYRYKNMVPRSQ